MLLFDLLTGKPCVSNNHYEIVGFCFQTTYTKGTDLTQQTKHSLSGVPLLFSAQVHSMQLGRACKATEMWKNYRVHINIGGGYYEEVYILQKIKAEILLKCLERH